MFPAFSGLLSMMYADKMDVYHYTATTNADHTKDTKKSTTPDILAAPCKISFNTTENPLDNEVSGTLIKTTMKVFCGTSVAVKEGDWVVLTKTDGLGHTLATYQGKLGLPAMFPTHQEIPVGVVENA